MISMNLTLNDETRGFLGAAQFARMKPGVIFVNTARAALVDEAAFLDALRNGRIRHAGLDVFHDEPLKPDHPLARMENVTLTAHAAFRTLEASMTLAAPLDRHRARHRRGDLIHRHGERSEAIQGRLLGARKLDCFVALLLAMTQARGVHAVRML